MISVIARPVVLHQDDYLVAPHWALFTVCGSNKSPPDMMWNASVLSRTLWSADNNYPQPDWLRPPRPRANFPFSSLQKILCNLLFGCPLEYSAKSCQPNADLRQFNLKLHNMLKGCNDILCYMHQNHLAWQWTLLSCSCVFICAISMQVATTLHGLVVITWICSCQ